MNRNYGIDYLKPKVQTENYVVIDVKEWLEVCRILNELQSRHGLTKEIIDHYKEFQKLNQIQ
jgi:uncharacterized protein HemY